MIAVIIKSKWRQHWRMVANSRANVGSRCVALGPARTVERFIPGMTISHQYWNLVIDTGNWDTAEILKPTGSSVPSSIGQVWNKNLSSADDGKLADRLKFTSSFFKRRIQSKPISYGDSLAADPVVARVRGEGREREKKRKVKWLVNSQLAPCCIGPLHCNRTTSFSIRKKKRKLNYDERSGKAIVLDTCYIY